MMNTRVAVMTRLVRAALSHLEQMGIDVAVKDNAVELRATEVAGDPIVIARAWRDTPNDPAVEVWRVADYHVSPPRGTETADDLEVALTLLAVVHDRGARIALRNMGHAVEVDPAP
jgi:hypothetical protein